MTWKKPAKQRGPQGVPSSFGREDAADHRTRRMKVTC
eukprot:CAMPEP_0174750264 /NCGR_PEP_ID=MMETSP1094-20130205/97385_1 /TAXON_ID=156173 /ORGANISM="Chrysochromulina brevifilum, Strain UTEX LB 985" /LENGTH=36 /DNA_ID= /DNA_START= /DNA_END= /DNA_ORIENTATION=